MLTSLRVISSMILPSFGIRLPAAWGFRHRQPSLPVLGRKRTHDPFHPPPYARRVVIGVGLREPAELPELRQVLPMLFKAREHRLHRRVISPRRALRVPAFGCRHPELSHRRFEHLGTCIACGPSNGSVHAADQEHGVVLADGRAVPGARRGLEASFDQ